MLHITHKPLNQGHNPKDLNSYLHCFENLKSCTQEPVSHVSNIYQEVLAKALDSLHCSSVVQCTYKSLFCAF